jgi:uncharacterized membrane protein
MSEIPSRQPENDNEDGTTDKFSTDTTITVCLMMCMGVVLLLLGVFFLLEFVFNQEPVKTFFSAVLAGPSSQRP